MHMQPKELGYLIKLHILDITIKALGQSSHLCTLH